MKLTQSNPEFIDAIKQVENNIDLAKRRGDYKETTPGNGDWRWFPGKSVEGGLPTLAYGHKITPKEWSTKRLVLGDTSKDLRFGITDAEATTLVTQDLDAAETIAETDWNGYMALDKNLGTPIQSQLWVNLKPGYKMVLVDKVFNSGSLVRKGKWYWTTLGQAIFNGRDEDVVKASPAKYRTSEGDVVSLTSRAIVIDRAAGLPWQVLGTDDSGN